MAQDHDLREDSGRLEAAFFAGENAELLRQLRLRTDDERLREQLREVVKIKHERFLDRLVALGVRPETALALTLIPLLFVAWADGRLDERERKALLDAAEQRGVAAAPIARQLLANGLARQPDPRLFSTWKSYVKRLWGYFTADERWQMRQNLLRSTREVAEAAGGFLGLTSKISEEERKILQEIEALLD
jgi:hypothetical protein